MKAVDFIKKYGWEISKAFLNNWSGLSEDYGFKVNDLKRYVDAWELVQKYKGTRGIRFRIRWGQYRYGDSSELNNQLKQAIALVEEVENA